MYSDEQYRKALEVYEETKSVTKTITILGYPARRQTLYNWIHRKRILPEERSTFRGYNTEDHPLHPSLEQKLQILHRCFELGEDVQSVSNEVGYSTASIYAWRRKYIQKGAAALMNPPNERRRGKLIEGNAASSQEIDELKTKIQDMQIELDILKETINVLKKDPGINKSPLSNGEKAVIADALKISPEVPNVIQRNFKADKPNQKWLTDVTEFSIPAGKVYLSPVIDCYDGMPVAWNISCKPDAQLVNTMLDRAIHSLPQDVHPILHSDRGCHYR